MITEDYVSYEVAKLLKEKGFNEPTTGTYYKDGTFSYNKEGTSCILGVPADNSVDACYEMILKLHKLNLL